MFCPRVLYVDDEPSNLSIFQKVFKRSYEVYIAESGSEGLEIMAKVSDIALVISDQRMPEMSGTEFLKEVSIKYPDCVRMLMTGYTDFEAVVKLINECGIDQYIAKPWKAATLQTIIDKALETYRLKQEKALLLEQLAQANNNLEEKVAEQTLQLQTQNQELKSLNEDLAQANELVKEKNLFLEKIMDVLPNSIYIWDCENEKLLFDKKSENNYLSYLPNSQVNGNGQRRQINAEDQDRIRQHISQFKYMEPEENIGLTYRLQNGEAQQSWLMSRETIFKSTADGKTSQVLGIIQDITSMKRAEQRLKNFKNGLKALKLISSDTSLDFNTQLKNAIRFITNYWGMEIGIIARTDGTNFTITNAHAKKERYRLEQGQVFKIVDDDFLHQDALALTSKTPSDHQRHPCFTHLPVRAYIGCNFSVNGKHAGMINILSTKEKFSGFGAYDLDFIRLFAKWVGFTIERDESTKRLEAMNHTKDRILATVAHDLRSPINAIKGSMFVMKYQLEGRIQKEDQELFDMVENSCTKTLGLIQELLDSAEMEDENFVLHKEEVTLNAFIENTLASLILQMQKKQVNFELNIEDTHDLIVEVNKRKFARVLDNLVSNALKFTPEGGTITIHTLLIDKFFHLSIQDTGIGIPKNLQPIIFDKFSEARRSGLAGEKSTGLGMYIVKQIVNLHGGTITLESQESKGSTFKLVLPLF